MRKTIATLLAVLAVPLAAHAAPKAPAAAPAMEAPYYMTAKLGAYVPTADDMDGFNTGLAADVVVGRRMSPNFALEAGLGWFQTSTDSVLGNKVELSAFPIALSAKGILPFGQLELYGLGGASLLVARLETKGDLIGGVSDTETGFGLHMGVGAGYRLTRQLSLGVEGRYVVAEVNDLRMDGLMFNGGLSFNF
jgi:opacity protein-like surface antigen